MWRNGVYDDEVAQKERVALFNKKIPVTICNMRQKPLSNLEQYVMNIVWERKECSVRDVLEELQKKRKIAYSTAATILRRLEQKKLVVKNSNEMTFVYSPKISKESYSKGLTLSFLKKQVQSFGNIAMVSFVETIDELPIDKREYFLKLLEDHDKNK